jgi:hemerythrin-like domain-containing protein
MVEFVKVCRRSLVAAAGFGAAALVSSFDAPAAEPHKKGAQGGAAQEKEVGAVEDLIREHGVLRRALLVYEETAPKLRTDPGSVPPDALNRTAELFRTFGEDYHEKKLEEAYIFPAVKKADGPAASLADVLKAQHDRGREITDYILAVTGQGTIGAGDAEPLARAFDSFVRMYQNHTAREDTVVFPAWKRALSNRQLHDMGETFEDIEKQQFGHDGFEDAVMQMGGIEQALGLADLARFTAPPPPKA